SPNPSTANNLLLGVTCPSATLCWAVGLEPTYINISRPLIERYDGTSWTVARSPSTSSAPDDHLSGVWCNSSSDCWAVGSFRRNGYPRRNQTLIQHFDGSAWRIISSPNTSVQQNNFLTSVTCASTADCWAVGLAVVDFVSQAVI